MIPRAFIDAWRTHAPWRSDAMVEQDLIISRSLVGLFSHPALSERLVFRGGTAIHKLFLPSPRRYSEDIDMVQIEAGPIGPVFDALRDVLTPLLGRPQRKQGPGVVTLTYRMVTEIPPVTPLRLKVEINSREHFAVRGVQKRRFAMVSPWFTGACDIPTFDVHELMATKLRALYQRRKGRDLFDLWLGLTDMAVDGRQVVEIFRNYMAFEGHTVSRAEFAANLDAKRLHPGFRSDLGDLLPVGSQYDDSDGFAVVERDIVPWL